MTEGKSFTGSLAVFAGTFSPHNWAFCGGQILAIVEYTALYSIIGDAFGGDGRSTLGLPDLRGRAVLGEGTGPDLTARFRGQIGGYEEYNLDIAQMPAHTHEATGTATVKTEPDFMAASTFNAFAGQDSIDSPGPSVTLGTGHYLGTQPVAIYADETSNTTLAPEAVTTVVTQTQLTSCEIFGSNDDAGAGLPVDNMPPFTVIGYFICTDGAYPARN